MELVKLTTKLSILVQGLSLFPTIRGVVKPVTPEKRLLRDTLRVELAVTLVQLTFYLILLHKFNLAKMAVTRYYDWFITTPTMLFSMASYFTYVQNPQMTIREIIQKYKTPLVQIFIANFFMLLAGYMAEVGVIDRKVAFVLGFAAFAIAFGTLKKQFVTDKSKNIFNTLATVWGLYGVAFMLPDVEKNVMYNGLDIISKNFFAVFLSYSL